MLTIEQVVTEIEVDRVEVVSWIERSWVLPSEAEGGYLFDEADLARVRLIAELRRDLEVGEEAMPLVLRLLDQVYTLRRALNELQEAVKALPDEARAAVEARLRKRHEGGSAGS